MPFDSERIIYNIFWHSEPVFNSCFYQRRISALRQYKFLSKIKGNETEESSTTENSISEFLR